MQRTALTLNILIAILLLLVSARILADLAAYKIGTLTPSRKATQAEPAIAAPFAMPFNSFGVILEKGLFGAATKGQLTTIETPRTAIAATSEAAQPAVPTDLTLLGTVAGTPRQSFALIRKTSTNEERVFKIGEQVFNLGLLSAVEKEAVTLNNNGKTTTLRTPDSALEEPKPAAVTPKANKKPAASGIVAASTSSGGIIEQRALNAALNNIGQVMTDARMLPYSKDGVVEGFELSEVRAEGVFGSIGLKDGDVLQKINDFPIDSPEKAIQSFMTLKGQTNIRLGLIRDGSPTTLSYEIR